MDRSGGVRDWQYGCFFCIGDPCKAQKTEDQFGRMTLRRILDYEAQKCFYSIKGKTNEQAFHARGNI